MAWDLIVNRNCFSLFVTGARQFLFVIDANFWWEWGGVPRVPVRVRDRKPDREQELIFPCSWQFLFVIDVRERPFVNVNWN